MTDVSPLFEDGLIEVFFDDMSFTRGRIGLGSFVDAGQFDDVQVWGCG